MFLRVLWRQVFGCHLHREKIAPFQTLSMLLFTSQPLTRQF